MPRRVAIVPHTHWDREWYASFQTFRLRLVALLDEFLPFLEREPAYTRFLLDGQTAVIDDYLEVRPEAEAALKRLAAQGRLSVGPWMILMDEFMVSGETIVRDLQMGLARASEFGGAMPVGYLPDMFGHIAQMPQILAAAGFEHAVVWRGVPASVDRNAFWWIGPDGSRVRAEYLYGSYSNGRDIPSDAKDLVQRARDYEGELGAARLGDLLLMNGTDHQAPQPWLGRVVAEANAMQGEYEFAVTSLAEYVTRQPTDGLPSVRGELRSGARANILMGVASNRVDVHQACAIAERAVERRAEPATALFLPRDRYPTALLREAWRALVLNSAHDSSCACSHDEVVEQVVVRYREARQIADGLTRQAVDALAARVDAEPGATLVVNTAPARRAGVVEAPRPGDGPVHVVDHTGRVVPSQVLRTRTGTGFSAMTIASKAGWVLDLVRGAEFAGFAAGEWTAVQRDDGVWSVEMRPAYGGAEPISLDPLREWVLELADTNPNDSIRFAVVGARVRDVVFATHAVDGFGWATYQVVDGEAGSEEAPVQAGDTWLSNEHVRVDVDPGDGTLTVTTPDGLRVAGLNRYVDGGDGGDTYNYSPPPVDTIVDRPDAVAVAVDLPGPVVGRLAVTAQYAIPAACEGDAISTTKRTDDHVPLSITTSVEVRAGEPFVRVHTEYDNGARDHRLRAHFPLPTAVTASHAECAFAVVERGLTAEGGPQEYALPTFPSRRFVDCSAADGSGGIAIVHDGLLEYEVVDGGRELALTLLRATGWLARIEPAYRPNPAGPAVAVHDAQMLRRVHADYALVVHRGDWRAADLYALADAALVPFERTRISAEARELPATGSMLTVTGGEVAAVLRDDTGNLHVRVFNPSDAPATVSVALHDAPVQGWTVDLRGRARAPFDGGVELGPWELATLQLNE
jgi:hypothetical protein